MIGMAMALDHTDNLSITGPEGKNRVRSEGGSLQGEFPESKEGRHTAHLGDEPQRGIKVAAFRSSSIVIPPRRVSLACVALGTIRTYRLCRFVSEKLAAKDTSGIAFSH